MDHTNTANKENKLFRHILEDMNRKDEFTDSIGIEITSVCPHEAEGILHPRANHVNPVGTVHGGCICALMDAVGGAAGASSGFGCITIDCNLHFFKAAKPSATLYCRATPLSLGHRIQVFDVSVSDADQVQIAKGIYTYRLVQPIGTE